ncbi:MAG: hypothetical protein K8S87_12655 [Planctomycetes bacterium]|nr:hypothetical protein [Planctomycetota bacterium]
MRLILNPSSRSGKGKKLWNLWKKSFEKAHIDFECCETKSERHAFELAKESKNDVVSVGGDGTINQVLNGVLESDNYKSMGVLYAGTSPDFCTFHNIPIDPQNAFNILKTHKEKKVDVVEISYQNIKGECINKYFACSSNIGLGADIARFANKWRKLYGDTMGTGLGVFKSIIQHNTFSSTVIINNQEYNFNNTNHIFIIKNPFIASGLKLNLNINPDDGNLYVMILHGLSRFKLILMLKNFYTGKIKENNNIFIKTCTSVAVKTPNKKEIEFDGDPKGFTDISVKIVPRKLSLICGYNNA